jgi:alkylated DNA repair dioxygenase AlkB
VPLSFQPSLFDRTPASVDATFSTLVRIPLDETSWVDHAPGWLRGSDVVFDEVLRTRRWGQRSRWMYDRRVREPRLTAPWNARSGVPLEPRVLDDARLVLAARYGVPFDSAGFNLYRDGDDSVAWHSDHFVKGIDAPVIALVSLGEPRKFLLRPKGGGRSIAFHLGRGDLLVTGGASNDRFEHAVPKVARAGPRISVAFRYGMDPRAYARKKLVDDEGDDA